MPYIPKSIYSGPGKGYEPPIISGKGYEPPDFYDEAPAKVNKLTGALKEGLNIYQKLSPFNAVSSGTRAVVDKIKTSPTAKAFVTNQSKKLQEYTKVAEPLAQTSWKNIGNVIGEEMRANEKTPAGKISPTASTGATLIKYAPVVLAKIFNTSFDPTGTDTNDYYAAKNRGASIQWQKDVDAKKIDPAKTPPPYIEPVPPEQMSDEDKVDYGNYVSNLNKKKVIVGKSILLGTQGALDASRVLAANTLKDVAYNIAGPDATKWMEEKMIKPETVAEKIAYGAGAVGGTLLDYYTAGKVVNPLITNLESGTGILAPVTSAALKSKGVLGKGMMTVADAFLRNSLKIVPRAILDYALADPRAKDTAITNFNNITGQNITTATDTESVRYFYNKAVADIDAKINSKEIDPATGLQLKRALSSSYYEFGKNAFNTAVNSTLDAALFSISSLFGVGKARLLQVPSAFISGFASAKLQHQDNAQAIQSGAVTAGMAAIGLIQSEINLRNVRSSLIDNINKSLPTEDKLSSEATSEQINTAINSLTYKALAGGSKSIDLLKDPTAILPEGSYEELAKQLVLLPRNIVNLKLVQAMLTGDPYVYTPWFQAAMKNYLIDADIAGLDLLYSVSKNPIKNRPVVTADYGPTEPAGPTQLLPGGQTGTNVGLPVAPKPITPTVTPATPSKPVLGTPVALTLEEEVANAHRGDYASNKVITTPDIFTEYFTNPEAIESKFAPVVAPEKPAPTEVAEQPEEKPREEYDFVEALPMEQEISRVPIQNTLYQEARKYKSATEFVNSTQKSTWGDYNVVRMDVPIDKLISAEPSTAALEVTAPGREITEPVEVLINLTPRAIKEYGEYVLLDGNHRVQQARLNGAKTISALVGITKTGYDKNGDVIGNTDELTPSQLTKIWNEAHQKQPTKPPTAKYDFVEALPIEQEISKKPTVIFTGTSVENATAIMKNNGFRGKAITPGAIGDETSNVIYLTKAKRTAASYTDTQTSKLGQGKVVAFDSSGLKIATEDDAKKIGVEITNSNALKKAGFDGADMSAYNKRSGQDELDEIVVWNKEKLIPKYVVDIENTGKIGVDVFGQDRYVYKYKLSHKITPTDIEAQTTPAGDVVPVKAITPEMVESADTTPKGFNDIRGNIAKDAKDVANILQQFRDRTKEIAHIIYTNKDGLILGHIAFTSDSFSYVYIPDKETAFKIKQRAINLGADTIYIAHNHPSGKPIPSPTDLSQAEDFSKRLTGPVSGKVSFGGSIVLDHDGFSVIKMSANDNAVFTTHKVPDEFVNKSILKPTGVSLGFPRAEEMWIGEKYGWVGVPEGKYVVAIVTPERILMDSREFNVTKLSTTDGINNAIGQYAREKKGLPIVFMESSTAAELNYNPVGVISLNLHNKATNDYTSVDLTRDYSDTMRRTAKRKILASHILWQDIVPISEMSEEDAKKIADTIVGADQFKKLKKQTQLQVWNYLSPRVRDDIVKSDRKLLQEVGGDNKPLTDVLNYFKSYKIAYPKGQNRFHHTDEYNDLPAGVMTEYDKGLQADEAVAEFLLNFPYVPEYSIESGNDLLDFLRGIQQDILTQTGEFRKPVKGGDLNPIVKEIESLYDFTKPKDTAKTLFSPETLKLIRTVNLGQFGSGRQLFSLPGNKAKTSPMFNYLYGQMAKDGFDTIIEPYGGAGTGLLNSLKDFIQNGGKRYITNIFDIEKFKIMEAIQNGRQGDVKMLVNVVADDISNAIYDKSTEDIRKILDEFKAAHPNSIIGGKDFYEWAKSAKLYGYERFAEGSALMSTVRGKEHILLNEEFASTLKQGIDEVYVKDPTTLKESVAKAVIEKIGIHSGPGQAMVGAAGFKDVFSVIYGNGGFMEGIDALKDLLNYAETQNVHIQITNKDATQLLDGLKDINPGKTFVYMDPPYVGTYSYRNVSKEENDKYQNINDFFKFHQGYYDLEKNGARLAITNGADEDFAVAEMNHGHKVLFYKENTTETIFTAKDNVLDIIDEYLLTPTGKEGAANVMLAQVRNAFIDKDFTPNTKGNIRRAFGIEDWKTATNDQLKEVLAYTDTLQPGDSLLTDIEKKGIMDLVNNGDILYGLEHPIDIVTRREAFQPLRENEDLPVAKLFGIVPLSPYLMPTSWIISHGNNPVMTKILTDAQEMLQAAGQRTQEKVERATNLLSAANKSRSKTIGKRVEMFLDPTFPEIFNSLETGNTDNLTTEELSAYRYIKSLFKEFGDELSREGVLTRRITNYVPHIEAGFLENVFEFGPMAAIRLFYKNKEKDLAEFNPIQELAGYFSTTKAFRFAKQRKGGLVFTKNLMRIISEYSTLVEDKRMYDKLMPMVEVAEKNLIQPRNLKFLDNFTKNLFGKPMDKAFRTGEMRWAAIFLEKSQAVSYMKALSLNIPSAAKNIISAFGMGTIWYAPHLLSFLKGTAFVFEHPGRTKDMLDKYGLRENTFSHYMAESFRGGTEKLASMLMFPHSFGEYIIRGAIMASEASPEELETGTLSIATLRRIKSITSRTQQMFNKAETPLFMQTIIGKSLFQYNRWRIPAASLFMDCVIGSYRDIKTKNVKHSEWIPRLSALIMLAIFSAWWTTKIMTYLYKKGRYNRFVLKMLDAMASLGEGLWGSLSLMGPGLIDILFNNPSVQDAKAIAFDLQMIASILIKGIKKPSGVEYRSGILHNIYIAPLNQYEDITSQPVTGKKEKTVPKWKQPFIQRYNL